MQQFRSQPRSRLQGLYAEYGELARRADRDTDAANLENVHSGAANEPSAFAAEPPIRQAPAGQVLLSRNGVGKTTICNHLMQLGQVEPASKDQAPKRLQETEQGRELVAVSEAVAELLDEDGILCPSWRNIEFVQNPHPDCQLQQQEEAEEQLTIDPIRNFVRDGAPEEHLQRHSFLFASARKTGTTTNSTTKIMFGHIPGAVERFKSKQQLQAEAFEFVQLPNRDDAGLHHWNKLAERYKAITGRTESDALPETVDAVILCDELEAVAGKIQLYSGHAESLTSFRCFLRSKLTGNQVFSPLHLALESTTVYWPSDGLQVPLLDTPGTDDANILNEAATWDAVNDTIKHSSQLLVLASKSLKAEATLEHFVIPYMQFMIRDPGNIPCIRGVVLPETTGRFNHKTVCSDFDVHNRQERINASMEQLETWLNLANAKLPASHRTTPERLAMLLQRCEVKVVCMNLYASLCLQSASELMKLADEAGSAHDKDVTVPDLLEATGGPWLLGLSAQLAAENVLPDLEELHDTHVEALVRTLNSRRHSTGLSLSGAAKLSLSMQSTTLLKNKDKRDSVLQLHKRDQLRDLNGKMAGLKTEACLPFAKVGKACKNDCAGQHEHISCQWTSRLASTSLANVSGSLAKRKETDAGAPRTAAFRTTFGNISITAPGIDDLRQSAQAEGTKLLTAFAEEHIYDPIVNGIVECLKPGVAQPEHAAVQKLIEQVAESCVMPKLTGQINRFVKKLVDPARLKASLKQVLVKAACIHLLKGPLASSQPDAARQELLVRVEKTLKAAEADMERAFDGHVVTQIQNFVGWFTKDGNHYSGGCEQYMKALVREVGVHVRGNRQPGEQGEEHNLLSQALQLQQKVKEEITAMRAQASTSAVLNNGMAASLHRVAKLTAALQQDPDIAFLLGRKASAPRDLLMPNASRLDLDFDWAELVDTDLSGVLNIAWQHKLQGRGLGLPAMADSDWERSAKRSLPAALQHLLWPTNQAVGAYNQERQRIWHGIEVSMAEELISCADESKAQAFQSKVVDPAGGIERYVEQLLHGSQQMGFLELLAFMLSGVGQREEADGQCIQVWHPSKSEPTVLFYANQDGAASESSRRSHAYNLLAVELPKSRKIAWVPLVKSGYIDIDDEWEHRLYALDDQLAETQSAADSKPNSASTSAQPDGVRSTGLRGRTHQGTAAQRQRLRRARKRVPESSLGQCNPRKRH